MSQSDASSNKGNNVRIIPIFVGNFKYDNFFHSSQF